MGDIHATEKRLDEVITCLKFAFDIAETRKVDVVLLSGDLFDSIVINQQGSVLMPIIDTFSNFIKKSKIPVVAIYGTTSHDIVGSLEILKHVGVRVSGVTELIEDYFPYSIITFPYSRSMGTTPKERLIERLMRLSASAKNPYRIFTAHMSLQDVAIAAYTDVRMPSFTTEDLIPLGCHYYALGHIHNGESPQLTGNIRYCGSLWHCDFGDISEKGFYIAYFDNGAFVKVERFHTPSTPIINVKGEDAATADVKGKRVKMKLRVDITDVDPDKEEKLRQELLARGAVDVKIERIIMPKSEIRASLSGAETIAARVKIWCESVGYDFKDSFIPKCEEVEARVGKIKQE